MELGFIIGLVTAGMVLLFLEALLPGGILGVAGFGCMAGAAVLGFSTYGTRGGLIIIGVSIVGAPISMVLGLWLLPRTRFGKKMLDVPEMKRTDVVDWTAQSATGTADVPLANKLRGAQGLSLTQLRPAGVVEIGGERYDVVTSGELIEKGVRVRVVAVDSNRIVVERELSN